MKKLLLSGLIFVTTLTITRSQTPGEIWVKIHSGNEIPSNAMIGGKDSDGSPLFVAHANYNGNWHPGKTRKSWNSASIEYGGQEIYVPDYEVLIGKEDLNWVIVSNGNVPNNTVISGHENQNDLLTCRCEFQGSTQVGKTWRGNKACNIGYGGKGINVLNYEVLVRSTTGAIQSNSSDGSQETIYIAGYTNNNSSNGIAKIWKNGVATSLTDGKSDGFAYGLFVSGNDIYVAGADGFFAKYWKNGIGTNLTDGSGTAYAHSIFVKGQDVYVAGVVGAGVVTLWKNGVATTLSDGKDPFAMANSVFVNGSDVFVCGTDHGSAKIWKNGVAMNLSDGKSHGVAYAVVVNDNHVYVAGTENDVAKIWKDGIGKNLTDGSNNAVAYSIAVNERGVFVAGNDGPFASMWVNGVATKLTDGTKQSFAKAICLKGDDNFVAGNNGTAFQADNSNQYWKNGVAHTFDNSCYISSIIVK